MEDYLFQSTVKDRTDVHGTDRISQDLISAGLNLSWPDSVMCVWSTGPQVTRCVIVHLVGLVAVLCDLI